MVWHMIILGVVLGAVAVLLLRIAGLTKRHALVRTASGLVAAVLFPLGVVSVAAGISTDDWVELTPRPVLSFMLAQGRAGPMESITPTVSLPVPAGRPWDRPTRFEQLRWYHHLAQMHHAWYELATGYPADRLAELIPVARRIQQVNGTAGSGQWRDAWPARGIEWDYRERARRDDTQRSLPVGMWAASEMESLTAGVPEMKRDLVYPPPQLLAHFAASDDINTVLFAIERAAPLTPDPYRDILLGLRQHESAVITDALEPALEWQDSLRKSVTPNGPGLASD